LGRNHRFGPLAGECRVGVDSATQVRSDAANQETPFFKAHSRRMARLVLHQRIGQQLKAHYQALASEELPPRLLVLLKKLDEETEHF
jgi:hypothetical protein